ncbi:hypothetical protein [Azospirillum halopraeferens]|uniref:hypothetical protein n=1 Tax=Azospirillum halopraeferens TaxID=34010 RepID=UPI0004073729|nr:hypothetical protein [Azospirillum halopraeferens]
MVRERDGDAGGMAVGRNSYEVQVYKVDHWVLDTRFEDEAQARDYGKKLLWSARAEGYRVVRDWQRPDGRHVETELVSEFRGRGADAIAVSPIDEAPDVCHRMEEYYGVESRMVMNRLLRGYTERMVVTPTEIMHNYGELKRLRDKDSLVPSAVGRVAALQADRCGGDGRARRDEIFAVVDAMTERARTASARKDLPQIARTGIRPAYEALGDAPAPEERDFLARVVLSRDLVQMRNWLAKLDFLSELVREDGGLTDRPLVLVDGVIADVLGAPSVVQDLLGTQRNLAEALCSVMDLSRGRLSPAGRSDDDRALQLSELLAFHDLDETRRVLVDLVRRQLRGTPALNRADPGGERDAFDRVLAAASGPDGLFGGPAMAEALVRRYMRFLEAGGAPGRRQAIAEVPARLPDAADRVRFLMALAGSDIGRGHAAEVGDALERLTGDAGAFARFVDRNRPIKDNLEALTRLYRQVAGSALAEPLRGRLADNVDDLLCAYIQNSRVVERLDNPEDVLRLRANRLIQLCAPGTLQSRKALDIVRRRVIDHLRQPNFERRYVADIVDPAMQQRALRDFYALLGQAGFR